MSRQMKDSGIEWIGEIPCEWKVIKNKYIMHKVKTQCDSYNGEDIISLTLGGVVVRDLSAGGKMPNTFVGYQFIEPGDLLLCLFDIDVTPRCVGLVKNYGLTSPAYSRFIVHTNYCNEYYDYLLRYIDDKKIFLHLAKNLRNSLTEGDFGAIQTIVPPYHEQIIIASYLDKKCAYIDSVIEKTKEAIEEYKKLKQAIITQAVTKGVRGDRTMKDSGVEWIGQIPSEWEVKRLKYLFDFGKGLPITKDNLVNEGTPVISYGQIHAKFNTRVSLDEKLFRYVKDSYIETNKNSLVKEGDIIVADTSEDLEGCGNSAYVDRNMTLFAGYHTIVLKSKNGSDNKYLAYQMNTDSWRNQIRCKVFGVKLFSITKKILNDVTYIVPSISEKEEIVEYLDEKCSIIDRIIEKKSKTLEELELLKKSLIYEYVTGKKEVSQND